MLLTVIFPPALRLTVPAFPKVEADRFPVPTAPVIFRPAEKSKGLPFVKILSEKLISLPACTIRPPRVLIGAAKLISLPACAITLTRAVLKLTLKLMSFVACKVTSANAVLMKFTFSVFPP